MATMRAAPRHTEENAAAKDKHSKPAGDAGLGGEKRRAFGDIGNVQGVTTRAQAAALKNGSKPQTSLRARDPNATAAVLRTRVTAPATRPAGVSLSSLLQNRSDAAAAATARAPSAPPASPLPDIDRHDRLDPLEAVEYVNNIYSYYRRVEPKFRVSSDYMGGQVEINEKMRAILIDWLVEVHLKFKLMPETLYLTTNLIDRFLEAKNVTRKRLQLVGVTAMLIASKYEEIWAPEVRDFVYISDKAYTREEILGMEKSMLSVLQWNLTLPTLHNFLARFRKAACIYKDDIKATQLCEYLAQLSLVDFSMLRFKTSIVAAAVLHVALAALDREDAYPVAVARHSGYSLDEVLPCSRALLVLMGKAGPDANLNAVYKKFSSSKFAEVALTPVPVLPSDISDSEDSM